MAALHAGCARETSAGPGDAGQDAATERLDAFVDPGVDGGMADDAAVEDASTAEDGGPPDAGELPSDGGAPMDATTPVDAGTPDVDAGPAPADAGVPGTLRVHGGILPLAPVTGTPALRVFDQALEHDGTGCAGPVCVSGGIRP